VRRVVSAVGMATVTRMVTGMVTAAQMGKTAVALHRGARTTAEADCSCFGPSPAVSIVCLRVQKRRSSTLLHAQNERSLWDDHFATCHGMVVNEVVIEWNMKLLAEGSGSAVSVGAAQLRITAIALPV